MNIGRYSRCLWRCIVAALVTLPLHAVAQERDLFEMNFEEVLNTPVMGVSKNPIELSKAPASVTVISSEEIARFAYRTVSEAVSRVAGVYFTDDLNYQYLGMRGISRPGDYSSRILVLLDGHRMNDANYDYAPIGHDLSLDVRDIERIEVIKGPASAAWGSNALLGVINIITKDGDEGNNVALEGGSAQTGTAWAQLADRASDDSWFYSFQLSGTTSANDRHLYFSEFDQPENNFGRTVGRDDESSLRGNFRGSYAGITLLVNAGSREKEIPTGSYGSVFNYKRPHSADASLRFDLSYETAFGENGAHKIFSRVFYDKVRYYSDIWYPGDESPWLYYDSSSSQATGAELRFTERLGAESSFLLGTELTDAYDMQANGKYTFPEFAQDITYSKGIVHTAVFAEAQLALLKDLFFTSGLRYDHYDVINMGEVSPKLGLVCKAFKGTSLKVLYGQAFRAPNAYELFYADSLLYRGNAHLKPETLRSYEFVAEQQIGGSTNLSLSLFKATLDRIITQSTLSDGFLQFNNLDSAETRGVELQLTTKMTNGFLASLGGSYTDAEDGGTGQWLSNSPRQLLAAGISLPLLPETLFFSPELRFISARKTPIGATIDSQCWGNAALMWHYNRNLRLRASVYNVFNNDLYSVPGNEHIQERIPNEDRRFLAEVQYKF